MTFIITVAGESGTCSLVKFWGASNFQFLEKFLSGIFELVCEFDCKNLFFTFNCYSF